jgi:hypothetical protein
MRCTQCAAASFSAAARTLVEQGSRCPQCGGALALAPERQPVGVAADPPPRGDRESAEAAERERRFER